MCKRDQHGGLLPYVISAFGSTVISTVPSAKSNWSLEYIDPRTFWPGKGGRKRIDMIQGCSNEKETGPAEVRRMRKEGRWQVLRSKTSRVQHSPSFMQFSCPWTFLQTPRKSDTSTGGVKKFLSGVVLAVTVYNFSVTANTTFLPHRTFQNKTFQMHREASVYTYITILLQE